MVGRRLLGETHHMKISGDTIILAQTIITICDDAMVPALTELLDHNI